MGPHPAVAQVRLGVRRCLARASLEAGDLVLAACSGGADSLALAAAVAFEAPRLGLAAGGVTVDHGLQPGSAEQAGKVVKVLAAMALDPVQSLRVTVARPGAAGACGADYPGPEAAARAARYRALDGAAAATGAAAILLGHTRDDQAETVLLGLARGSGARSLAGMAERHGPFFRPLLEVSRVPTPAACPAASAASAGMASCSSVLAVGGTTPLQPPVRQATGRARVDATDMGADLEDVLITPERLQHRVGELAAQIDADYADRELLLVGVLKGAVMVMADLARAIRLPVQMDWMAVSSYGSGTKSSGVVRLLKDLDRDSTGRHVLVVEDIIDSGLTLSWLVRNLESRGPASLRVCALLRKPTAARTDVDVTYVGFDIADAFVIGYGLYHAERYRNLPLIRTLAPHLSTAVGGGASGR